MADEFNILTPNAMLGYGYKLDHFWYGVEKFKPAAIIVDSGSTDGGPYKLGLNKMTCGRGSYVRDLKPILAAAFHRNIKVLIGSVGGDGSTKHVSEMLGIIEDISQKNGYSFKVATIDAGISRDLIKSRIKQGMVGPCGPVPTLATADVDEAIDIVAQMGAEPYLEAMKNDPDIILGGRSYDPAPFAAFCISRGVSPGVAWHMGKIMECGGICAIPKGRSMIATMRTDSFDLTPLAPEERCTPLSVASHTLYEKTRPDRLPGPGGVLNLDAAKYEQVTEKTCRVSGAKFEICKYQIKLEGVTHLGYRTIFIGGIRDPVLIGQIDEFLESVRLYTRNLFPELDRSPDCRLIFHLYGKNAVMGPLEPSPVAAHEIGILGEVVAPTQELSHTIANNARASILHFPYKGQVATAGNFASPLSPHEQEAGPVFKFSLYHLVDLQPGEELSLFPVSYHIVKAKSQPKPLDTITEGNIQRLESVPLAVLSKKNAPHAPAKMADLAKIIRSKNSGPFELTLDIMFDSYDIYQRVKAANVLTNDTVKALYHISEKDIIINMFFDPALAWKCTIKRPWLQGSVGERDTLGTQQHAPLMGITVPSPNGERGSSNGYKIEVPAGLALPTPDRSSFTPFDSVRHLWEGLSLPVSALNALSVPGEGLGLPSSFRIGHIAQASIGISALAAALLYAFRNKCSKVPGVTVPLRHACAEFKSERLYVLNGKRNEDPWGPVGGLHKTSDGYVRIHDSFPNHRFGAIELLGLSKDATRPDLTEKTRSWASIDLEREAFDNRIVISALRSYEQWDMLPQAKAITNFPIQVRQLASGSKALSSRMATGDPDKCLRGLRVIELSRVIAAPLAGKTLAAHGADVIWVTSPNLPDLPAMDRDFARGKRSVHLDIRNPADKAKLLHLIKDADVFIQGYRPGSMVAHGLGPDVVSKINPNIIYANMCAYGPDGPWATYRGFDSLVQTCSGMNVSEAQHFGDGPARPTPCQALDHAGGYFLATGIMAALYKHATEGGSYVVDVSLAGCMKYLRSLGQFEGKSGFNCEDIETPEQIRDLLETRESGFGELRAVRHSAEIEGVSVGWELMPQPLGSDEPVWI